MSISRWLTWTPPRTTETTGKCLEPEPSKPPKSPFEGFGGRCSGVPAFVEARFRKNVEDDRDKQRSIACDPLWGDPCSCGGRDWHRKELDPNLQCLNCGRVVYSHYLDGGQR
jgi:hypothetical protein